MDNKSLHQTESQRDIAAAWTPAKGVRDGFPVFLGYFAVAFSLGIAAGNVGFTPFQGFIMSLTSLSSSGQYAGIMLFSENAGYIELALMILVSNARYILMSCALSQKFSPDTPFIHRLLIAFGLTDEMFGLGITTPGYLRPSYMYAALCTMAPGWALGTAFGVIAGNIMPEILSQAMNVAIFAMFLAIIIPPGRKDRHILLAVVISFASGLAAAYAPFLSDMSSGSRVLILTIVISSIIAVVFPVRDNETKEQEEQ